MKEKVAVFYSQLDMFKDAVGKRTIILISGKAGVGKTTSANILYDIISESNRSARIDNFARGVKRVARDMGWDGKKDDKGRKLLQNIGNTGREYNLDVWCNDLYSRIIENPDYDYLLIDDWRFPNEYDFLWKPGVKKIYTIRIIAPIREMLKNSLTYNDISERELDHFNFDFKIDNQGTLDELELNLRLVLDKIIRKEVER